MWSLEERREIVYVCYTIIPSLLSGQLFCRSTRHKRSDNHIQWRVLYHTMLLWAGYNEDHMTSSTSSSQSVWYCCNNNSIVWYCTHQLILRSWHKVFELGMWNACMFWNISYTTLRCNQITTVIFFNIRKFWLYNIPLYSTWLPTQTVMIAHYSISHYVVMILLTGYLNHVPNPHYSIRYQQQIEHCGLLRCFIQVQ